MVISRVNITEQAQETYLSGGADEETLLVGGPPAGVPDVDENICVGQVVLGGLEAAWMP